MITPGHKNCAYRRTKKKINPKESLHNLPKITFQKSGTSLSNKSPAFSVRAHLTLKSTYFIQLTGILLIN